MPVGCDCVADDEAALDGLTAGSKDFRLPLLSTGDNGAVPLPVSRLKEADDELK
jgi:hypothetical protein